jgi:hypothetical protein
MGGLSKEFDESLRSCPRLHRHGAQSLSYKRRGRQQQIEGLLRDGGVVVEVHFSRMNAMPMALL